MNCVVERYDRFKAMINPLAGHVVYFSTSRKTLEKGEKGAAQPLTPLRIWLKMGS
jgi:hypothetical protein